MCHKPWILTLLWQLSRQRELTESVRQVSKRTLFYACRTYSETITLLSENGVVKHCTSRYVIDNSKNLVLVLHTEDQMQLGQKPSLGLFATPRTALLITIITVISLLLGCGAPVIG